MNKVILSGHVGRDPQIRYIESRPVAEFTLATNEYGGKDADGKAREVTEWHHIVMFDRHALTAEQYIRKGTRLLIEGKLRTRSWQDRAGANHELTQIYTDSFEILTPRSAGK